MLKEDRKEGWMFYFDRKLTYFSHRRITLSLKRQVFFLPRIKVIITAAT
jgi:hypothetical protein